MLLAIKAVFQEDTELTQTLSGQSNHLETKTTLFNPQTLSRLRVDENNLLAKDGNLSIFLSEDYGVLKLIYMYEGEMTDRQKTDLFYLHVHLNDTNLLRE